MVEDQMLAQVPAAASNLKRKLDDLEPGEALKHAEDMRDDEAKSGYGFTEADGLEAKQPKFDDYKTERPDGPVNANGLKEEKPDEAVDASSVEVRTEQLSSVEEPVLVDYQEISVKEDSKEVLISNQEASIDVKEETKEVTVKEEDTVKEEESVEPFTVDSQQLVDKRKSDDPSSTDDLTTSRKIVVPNNKVGILTGKAGDAIPYSEYNLGAKIQITRVAGADPHAATRPGEIIGTLSNIDRAEKLINAVILEADAEGSLSLVARGLARGHGSKERIVRVTGDMRQTEIAQQMSKGVLSKRGLATPVDLVPQHEAADNSMKWVTAPHPGVIFIPQHPSDINVMKDAIVHLGQNDICCLAPEFSTEKQLIRKLSCSGRSVIIVTDHGAGLFPGIISSYTSAVVIVIPMRDSAVTGVPASLLGFPVPPAEVPGVPMSPEVPIVFVAANEAMEAARLAMNIFAFGDPEARILKKI